MRFPKFKLMRRIEAFWWANKQLLQYLPLLLLSLNSSLRCCVFAFLVGGKLTYTISLWSLFLSHNLLLITLWIGIPVHLGGLLLNGRKGPNRFSPSHRSLKSSGTCWRPDTGLRGPTSGDQDSRLLTWFNRCIFLLRRKKKEKITRDGRDGG